MKILIRTLKKCSIRRELNLCGWGPVAGSCEHGNEHSGSVKGDGYLLLRKDSIL
jgi:hypothetical protein